MKGSWRIARVAGIDLSVHWTFGLLLAWITYAATLGGGIQHGLQEGLFVLALFSCVVLHEFGHAMAARVFGIPTQDITLLPIGGVARLESIPRNPWQEWVIALAGPAVNVMIVGLLFPVVTLLGGVASLGAPVVLGGTFLERLLWTNVALVVFNLLPAFPMDGGRVLRAGLAMLTDYGLATRIATRVGQGVALLLGLAGLFFNPMLILVAGFVMLAGEAEHRQVQAEQQQRAGWLPARGTLLPSRPRGDEATQRSDAPAPIRAVLIRIQHPSPQLHR